MLLELSLALSAWKAFGGQRWALRCNPSSGNLHPTEAYVACAALPGIDAGVHHYASRQHALEQRVAIADDAWAAAWDVPGILVGLASIHWREAWKYGMRAWRYCQHDCGHAMAALCHAAAALGWHARCLVDTSDACLAALLGLDRDADFEGAEREAPDALLWIGHGEGAPGIDALRTLAQRATWRGRANRLSEHHVAWPDIEAIDAATRKPLTAPSSPALSALPAPSDPSLDPLFATLARQRRSAVEFDGVTAIGANVFFAMLDALLVRPHAPPWTAAPGPPAVHLALMVHRVTGLEPGLYAFLRDASVLPHLQSAMRDEWLWRKLGPMHLPLYLLLPHDLRGIAKLICCHQDIAADACFALGMIADLDAADGEPWRYRHRYWECGMIGHALYLEAEAAGVRSTGIGCYFDDEMHRLLGVGESRWQSLYHFTTGGPLDDPRLSTLPPYGVR